MTEEINRQLILKAYQEGKNRVLFLDYDGTLVPFCNLPRNSKMDNKVEVLIRTLASDPKNRIYIISGRNKEFLDEQFRGFPVGLVAEHGFRMKEAGERWEPAHLVDNRWRNAFITLFQGLCTLYPGSFIEQKESSLAYHYRAAGRDAGMMVKPVLHEQFQVLQQNYPGIELLEGEKVAEIKPESFNKGFAAARILEKGDYDFIMAAGDDLTDERMFEGLPGNAITVKVGTTTTSARYYVRNQKQFIEFLTSLCTL